MLAPLTAAFSLFFSRIGIKNGEEAFMKKINAMPSSSDLFIKRYDSNMSSKLTTHMWDELIQDIQD